ncbi:hypothetical protein Hanom_Chr17g01584251 [Helianthus anomalus]
MTFVEFYNFNNNYRILLNIFFKNKQKLPWAYGPPQVTIGILSMRILLVVAHESMISYIYIIWVS